MTDRCPTCNASLATDAEIRQLAEETVRGYTDDPCCAEATFAGGTLAVHLLTLLDRVRVLAVALEVATNRLKFYGLEGDR